VPLTKGFARRPERSFVRNRMQKAEERGARSESLEGESRRDSVAKKKRKLRAVAASAPAAAPAATGTAKRFKSGVPHTCWYARKKATRGKTNKRKQGCGATIAAVRVN